MAKHVWKYVLSQKPVEELSEMCRVIDYPIPGFRTGKVPNNMKKMVINHLLQPKGINKLTKLDGTLKPEWEEKYTFDELRMDELISIDDVPPSIVLQRFLLSNEEEKAISLYENWIEELGSEDSLRELDHENWENRQDSKEFEEEDELNEDDEEMTKEYLEIEINKDLAEEIEARIKKENANHANKEEWLLEQLHGILNDKQKGETHGTSGDNVKKKLEDKLEKMKLEFEKTKKQLAEHKETFKTAQKELHDQINSLKSEMGVINKEKGEIESKAKENDASLRAVIAEYEEQLYTLKKEKSELSARLLHAQVADVEEEDESDDMNIVLVGNPKNDRIFTNQHYHYDIVERDEIERYDFSQSKEIWVLTYKVDARIIKVLRKKVDCKVKEIKNFQVLKEEITKGRKAYEKQEVGY